MDRFKRPLIAVLIISLLFSLVSCSGGGKDNDSNNDPVAQKSQSELFDEHVEAQFIDGVTGDTLTLHSLLQNPGNYGITDYEITWGNFGFPSEEKIQNERRLIDEFNTFDRSELTPQQQETYDILAFYNSMFDEFLELYYYSDILQGDGDFYALPVVLTEFEFINEKDVEDYLDLLENFNAMTDALGKFEQEKAEKGLFMSDKLADGVIKNLEGTVDKKDDNILITSFDKKIDAMTVIDQTKKDAYITRNKTAFDNVVVPAYTKLAVDIKALKGKGKNLGGLTGFEKGKDYYKYSLKLMGASLSPEEYITALDKDITSVIGEFVQLEGANPTLYEDLQKDLLPDLSMEEIVEFWKNRSAADFPTLPGDVSYSLKKVEEEMQEILPPAFYLIPQIDSYKDNSIYYNELYKDDYHYQFFTLAHEGYPGHMLEKIMLMSSDLPDLRKIVSFDAYTEGWAQYTADYAYKYIDAKAYVKRYYQLSEAINSTLSVRVDLGVNYEGWSKDQLKDYVTKNYPNAAQLEQSVYDQLYDNAVMNPLQTAPYMLGMYEIQTLKEHFKTKTGTDYSDLRFHEEFLKRGAAPFALVKKWMEESWVPAEAS